MDTISWTDEVVARLRGLWDEGHSTAEIGRRLGTTKNAVVGKAHRLSLPAQPSQIRRSGSAKLRAPRVQGPMLPQLKTAAAPRVPALVPAPAPAPACRPFRTHRGQPGRCVISPAAGRWASRALLASGSATGLPSQRSPTARSTPSSPTSARKQSTPAPTVPG